MTGSCPPFIAEVKTMRGPKLLAARKPDLADDISRPRWVFLCLFFTVLSVCFLWHATSCQRRPVSVGTRVSISVSLCVLRTECGPVTALPSLDCSELGTKERSSRASRTCFKLVAYSTRQPFLHYCWHLLSVLCVTRYNFWCWCEWITVIKSVSDRVFCYCQIKYMQFSAWLNLVWFILILTCIWLTANENKQNKHGDKYFLCATALNWNA